MESFLRWFEDSQALERVVKLERQNRSKEDVVSKELFYMIKRVSQMTNPKNFLIFIFC